jgi:prepilin-type N-terminal cleavage/methylation domain-containing protein
MRRHARGVRGRERGFTLLELVVASAVSLLLGAAGFSFFRAQIIALTDQSAGLDAVEGSRAALDFVANDVRMAGAIPTGSCLTCGSGLANARADRLTVSWDANANGVLDATESITYAYDSATTSVTRTVNGVAQTLVRNVPAGGFALQYFNFDGTAAAMSGGVVTTAANVTTVRVTIRVNAARATNVFSTHHGARVTLRNRAAVLKRL